MKKVTFSPKELISHFVEGGVAAFLVSQGMDPAQAKAASEVAGKAFSGVSLEDAGADVTMCGNLQKGAREVLDTVELSPECRSGLEELLEPRAMVKFMIRPDADRLLRREIVAVCKQRDPGFDPVTFDAFALVDQIRAEFEAEVWKDPNLAALASYLMNRENQPGNRLHNANRDYANSFTEPLFLHKYPRNEKVCLENLFVMQDYDVKSGEGSEKHNLQAEISDFHKSDTPFLFIEGDAGSGKSTLTAWMNYHYLMDDETAKDLFHGRPVLTVRLRDLNRDDLREENGGGLTKAIRTYLNLEDLEELTERYPRAVLLLDGFDELCMIEGQRERKESLLYDLDRARLYGVQYIVTSRPNFLDNINLNCLRISLRHFDKDRRREWMERYTDPAKCGQTVDDDLRKRILEEDKGAASTLCDTPLTMYMLCAMRDAARYLENNWALYRYIFHDALSETEYNSMLPNRDRRYKHDIHKIRDVLYRISEEIAYRMYQSGNAEFHLSSEELSDIIQELAKEMPEFKKPGTKDIAERCYGLCCYWKAGTQQGAVEFLHNNIRDFFLAEKIYRAMNELTPKRNDADVWKTADTIAQELSRLCQYGKLEDRVLEFLRLRALYQAAHGPQDGERDFAAYEYQRRMVWCVIEQLSRDSFVGSGALNEKISRLNLAQRIESVVKCTVRIYRYAYDAHFLFRNDETTLIPWLWDGHDGSTSNDIQKNILITLFSNVFRSSELGLRGYFKGAYLRGAYLTGANLTRANLTDANLTDADLRGADLSGANLMFANLTGADLRGADLTDAYLTRADLTGADLTCANLTGANLTRANLRHACLMDANLAGADLTNAHLTLTTLPDGFCNGFCRNEQDEPVKHLKSLNIKGLKI